LIKKYFYYKELGNFMKAENCRYCADPGDIAVKVAELEATCLYLTRDQTYRGRCVLFLKDHKTEVFQMEPQELEAFARDMAKATKAMYSAFSPGKINYGAYGDTYPHLHFHLVPKYKDGKSWGAPFEMALQADKQLPQAELDELVKMIRKYL
jgi:diadenosine tetraphosphate (Ap4A) HIT family hydrolase